MKNGFIKIYLDPKIVDATRNSYRDVEIETSRFERFLIFLKLKKKLGPVMIKTSGMLMDLIPKVKLNKGGEKCLDSKKGRSQ